MLNLIIDILFEEYSSSYLKTQTEDNFLYAPQNYENLINRVLVIIYFFYFYIYILYIFYLFTSIFKNIKV
jgi:hypothetical protein